MFPPPKKKSLEKGFMFYCHRAMEHFSGGYVQMETDAASQLSVKYHMENIPQCSRTTLKSLGVFVAPRKDSVQQTSCD